MLQALRKAWLILFIAGSVAAIAVMLVRESAALALPSVVSWRYLALTVLAQVVFWWFVAVMWRSITALMTASNLGLLASFRQLALVSLGKYLPGKIWGIVARGAHMTGQGSSLQQATAATFYEQFILLHSAIALSAVVFAVQLPGIVTALVAAAAVASLFFGAAFSSLALRCGAWLASRLGAASPAADVRPVTNGVYLRLALGYTVIWILSGLVFLCLYRTFFGRALDAAAVSGLIVANALGIALGFFAVFAPAGIGVREAIAASILTRWIPLPEAATLVILFRLWVSLMDVLAGLTVLPWVRDIAAGRNSRPS